MINIIKHTHTYIYKEIFEIHHTQLNNYSQQLNNETAEIICLLVYFNSLYPIFKYRVDDLYGDLSKEVKPIFMCHIC